MGIIGLRGALFVAVVAVTTSAGGADAPARPSSSRPDLVATCVGDARLSACLAAGGDAEISACIADCVTERDERASAAASEAQDACEKRFVEALGKGAFTCGLVAPSTKREDAKKVIAQAGPQLKAAITARNVADADAIFARIVSVDAQDREQECTAACRTRGRSFLQAAKEAPGLVRGFKMCMVRADSTLEARKLQAYERDLYREYIDGANARCRTASRCDWLEEFSDLECTYATP